MEHVMQQHASAYARYWEAEFNRPEHYPLGLWPDPARYRPVADWVGRLIMPAGPERTHVQGVWIELHRAPDEHRGLVGQRLRLRWADTPDHHARLWGATRHVLFSDEARQAAADGTVLPERLDGLLNVNPLESLAAAHPHDDVIVRLEGAVRVEPRPADGGAPIIFAPHEPTQVTGRAYGLVRFLGPAGQGDAYRMRHYDREAGAFSGPEELVRLPEVLPDPNGVRNSTAAGIERSPLNDSGWYIYGALDAAGRFVVQALAPRALLRLEPHVYHDGVAECMAYLKPRAWRKAAAKGHASVALLCGEGLTPHGARESWREGDEALLIHLFGGIGGDNAEPAARTPLYWGHFAFGTARVVREPLSDELVFDIVYRQVYVHNGDGLTSGALHYSRYSGDRQYGWAGVRPIQDILIKHDAVTGQFEVFGSKISALDMIVRQLEVMTARYRIADGRGATRVSMANNCAQDSAQALYAAIRTTGRIIRSRPDLRAELTDTPAEAARLDQLRAIGDHLQRVLLPWGSARLDWEYGASLLGEEGRIRSLGRAMTSLRTLLPPVAARALVEVFLAHGASAWVLRSYQIGGDDPTIAPFVPNV